MKSDCEQPYNEQYKVEAIVGKNEATGQITFNGLNRF